MANVLKPKRRSADATAPTTSNLADGEIAINAASAIIYQRIGGIIVPVANYGWANGQTRFQADFNNATVANRAYFQAAATNGATVVGAIPNGTGTQSDFRAHSSSDPGNATYLSLQATSTAVTILSGFFGTGTQRDINISYNGTVQQKLFADGHVEAQAYFDSKGSVSGYRFWDRTNTTHAYVLYSDLDIARLVYSGGYEFTWNSTGVFTTMQVVASGSGAALFTGDRTTAAQYALYGAAGLGRIYHSTYGDVAQFDGTAAWTFANTVNIEGSLPAGYKNLVSAGANTWALGKVNMLTAGSNIGTGVAGATYMAYNNTAGNLTLTATAGVTARKAGTASVAPLTLLPRGFITIWYITTTECVCSGHLA